MTYDVVMVFPDGYVDHMCSFDRMKDALAYMDLMEEEIEYDPSWGHDGPDEFYLDVREMEGD